MAPLRPEEVTLPARFLCKTAHLVAVLTILFDTGNVAMNMEQIDPKGVDTSRSDLNLYNDRKNQLAGICYGAIACFAIEYICLFMGVSIFFPAAMSINVLCHFVGTILTVLLYVDSWAFEAFVAFFVIFNAVPAILELLTFLFITRFSFLKY